jgi:hypothetical protein
MSGIPASDIRGFNYSGSWGTSGLDLWQHHDNGTMAIEVARGKRYFPGWTVCRWWLSHEAFLRKPDKFLANFEAGLALFTRNDIQVMPVLFNRWRDPMCDFGGVPLDHIVPGFFNCTPEDFVTVERSGMDPWNVQKLFGDYLEMVVGTHATDGRILAWDLCNEPLSGPYVTDPASPIRSAELRWLTWCRDVCKATGAQQPLTIGNVLNLTAIEITEPITDLISFHPYYIPDMPDRTVGTKAGFETLLDKVIDIADRSGKPLCASETVWGAVDDAHHVELMVYTLGELVKRRIGFIVHALHHTLVADLHAAEYGPVGFPGRLEFINADGSLRMGHETFTDFAAGGVEDKAGFTDARKQSEGAL